MNEAFKSLQHMVNITDHAKYLQEQLILEKSKHYFWWYQIGAVVYPFGNKLPSPSDIVEAVGPTTLPQDYILNFGEPMVTAARRCLIRPDQKTEKPDWTYIACRIKPDDDSVHSLNGWRP